jgi:putative ABC transport system substrate-binding protein
VDRRSLIRAGLAAAAFGLSGCIALPGQKSSAATPSHIPRVGYLSPVPGSGGSGFEAFRKGLRDRGYIEGETIMVDLRTGPDLARLGAELADLPVDIIVSLGLGGLSAAFERSPNLPVVTLAGSDAVQAGLVASLAHPGGNITGLSAISDQVSGKRLALLHETAPGVTRVGAIWNPSSPGKVDEWRETERAAQTLSLEAVSLPVHDLGELAGVFETARTARIDGLVAFQDQVTAQVRSEITGFALAQGYPSIHEFESWTDAGGLLSYGPNRAAMSYRAADYVDRILRGQKPADMPVEQATVFDFIINMKTAQAIGLTIPPSIQSQATEILQ